MAKQSSRDAALARRMALASGGKTAETRHSKASGRVRSAADARPTRTQGNPASTVADVRSQLTTKAPVRLESASVAAAPLATTPARRSQPVRMANPSRDLVLSRREALSRRGKRADTSRDRTRVDVAREEASKPATAAAPAPESREHTCKCQEAKTREAAPQLSQRPQLTQPGAGSPRNGRSSTAKRTAQHNPSRALVLARREALSQRGKLANTPRSTGTAAVVRQANPDLNSRELALKIRELRSRSGAAAATGISSGPARPSGPRRRAPEAGGPAPAQDAPWKVGASTTTRGQVVTGTMANRSEKTTGNEASTCRPITGTEYLGSEIFRNFCGSDARPLQPDKVRVSATSHGNRVTGNEVGRSDKVTGDEPGTCKSITGTEYIGADQTAAWCGTSAPSPRKVGLTQTQAGRPVSGVMVGRSEKVTGDEPGSGRQITGDQYVTGPLQRQVAGQAPAKVNQFNTLRGTGVTGTHVGRSDKMTGDEPGSCRLITGDEYIGSEQYDRFCGTRPAPEAPKVGFSLTQRSLIVSGTRTGRSEKVTGDEAGTCKAVTGTPYAGLDEAGSWCPGPQVQRIRQRTPMGASTPGARLTGQQPGIGGTLTGASRGACEPISGTPYVGSDQFAEACPSDVSGAADMPRPLEAAPWERFSVSSPARAVTGTRTDVQGSARITGPFDRAGNKVTGTEQFRFDRRPAVAPAATPAEAEGEGRPVSRVTGEGSGHKITGDDWDRGDRVTGTEGVSARRRNPSRSGPVGAMAMLQQKRNETVEQPVSRVTGSSGNTDKGSLITVSGGARG